MEGVELAEREPARQPEHRHRLPDQNRHDGDPQLGQVGRPARCRDIRQLSRQDSQRKTEHQDGRDRQRQSADNLQER